MAVSVDIVFTVNNNTSVSFEEIEQEIKVSSLDMWKACDFYANFDRNMPAIIKMHLIDLEAGYLNYKLWRDDNNLEILKRHARG